MARALQAPLHCLPTNDSFVASATELEQCSECYKKKDAMMSRDDQRGRVMLHVSAHVLDNGLSATSLRQLAAAAGVSDRMLLYYFKDKADILTTVLAHIATEMSDLLATAVPESIALAPPELIASLMAATQADRFRPYMRLWIEITAAASRGDQPYAAIAGQIALGFANWIEVRLAGEPTMSRRATATMILAMIDGLAVLDMCGGREQSHLAQQAMQALVFPS